MKKVTLKDIVWGGRLRLAYSGKIWKIARKAAASSDRSVSGNMVTSREEVMLSFLDGGVWNVCGYFGPTSGTFWSGTLAKCYILYKLGLDPQKLLKLKSVPTLEELEAQVLEQKKTKTMD